MVQVNNIKVQSFKKYGFKTKYEALKLKVRGLPNETEKNYLERIKRIRIDKRKEEIENIKIGKEIEKQIEKEIIFDYAFSKLDLIGKINYFIGEKIPVPDRYINKFYDEYVDKHYLITFNLEDGGKKVLTLTSKWFDDIKKLLKNPFILEQMEQNYKSDELEKIIEFGIQSISVRQINPEKIFKNKNGKLFKYINKSNIDLKRYQIISENDSIDILKEHCLIHTFKLCGVDDIKINAVKLAFEGGSYISISKLNEIANIIDKCIILHKYENKSEDQRKINYGDINKDKIDIAIYEEHYFIYEQTIYNKYSIENYDLVKDYENVHNIFRLDKKNNKLYPRYKESAKIDSLKLVHLLFKQKLFESKHYKLNEFVQTNDKNIDIPLSEIERDQEEYEYPEKKDISYKIFYADTECLVIYKNHASFMCGIMSENDKKPQIYIKTKEYPNNHIRKMLEYIENNTNKDDKIIVYFHNLKYDFSVLKQNLNIKSRCIKDNQLYSVDATFFNRNIQFRDSYKLFNSPLKEFSKAFNLGDELNKKEAIGYTYYTEENIYEDKANIKEYRKHIRQGDQIQFMKNLNENKELFEVTEETFNHMEYYKYYLEYDCKVLCVYENTIRKITGLYLHDSLTISSLSNSYVGKNGCFDNIYQVKGNLRDYLAKAVYGGRVACLMSERMKTINKIINDYDACSLYPSAIYRLCQEYGLPEGLAKQITNEMRNKEILDTKTYYVVTVNIKKINKKQQIPFIAMRKKNGILDYVNEVPQEGYKCVIDKITLEDYIKFHEIEYEILDGVYYDEGFNKKFGEVIHKLYEDRLVEKKKGTPEGKIMQLILKLMMNSAYGKTIMKKSMNKEVIINNDKKESYIYNNFNCIKEIIELNDFQTIVKIDTIDDSYNLSIVGVMILSMSKRIMNEVMGIANDNNIKVYYQDTDSMHLEDKDIKKLEDLYYEKYNRVIKGENMGQFHSDFEIKGCKYEVKSKTSIFLGKKCYLDVLQGYDENGKEVEGVIGDHTRLKGITQAGIDKAVEYYGSAKLLFEQLAEGVKIDFTLNPNNNEKPMFEYNNLNVRTRKEDSFVRSLSFDLNLDAYENDNEDDEELIF